MRVLHQLIKHFWRRGALTKEQADYLVEHGFIRAHELKYRVHYLAVIAFWGECCQIVIRLQDVCYTENLATNAITIWPGTA